MYFRRIPNSNLINNVNMSRVKKPQQKLREIKFLNKMFIEKKVFSVAQKKELVCLIFTAEVPISKIHTAKFEIL